TVLGNHFIFTDAMLVDANPDRMRRITERFSDPIPGYSDLAKFDEDKSARASREVREILTRKRGGWSSYIFTDVNVRFTFAIRKKRLEISGEPYYAFVKLDHMRETSMQNTELTKTLQNSKALRNLNPKIYALNLNVFRIAAFLRKIKSSNAEGWAALVKE